MATRPRRSYLRTVRVLGPFGSTTTKRVRVRFTPKGKARPKPAKQISKTGAKISRQQTRKTKHYVSYNYKGDKRITPPDVVDVIRQRMRSIKDDALIVIRGQGGVPGGSPKKASPQNRYWSTFAIRKDQLASMTDTQIIEFTGLQGTAKSIKVTNSR